MKINKKVNLSELDPVTQDKLQILDDFNAENYRSHMLARETILRNSGYKKRATVVTSQQRLTQNLPGERDYSYEDQQLRFKLSNGGTDQFDFSKARISRMAFETFWELWKSNNKGEYSLNEIRDKYNELFKKPPEEIGQIISNIRTSIINPKPMIRDRILWTFDRKTQRWIFKILPLSH